MLPLLGNLVDLFSVLVLYSARKPQTTEHMVCLEIYFHKQNIIFS